VSKQPARPLTHMAVALVLFERDGQATRLRAEMQTLLAA
jgi:hypothetical protein